MIEARDLQSKGQTRFFYGYVVVIAGFLIMLVYSASRSAYGIFFNPMASEFGWSSALMSGPLSLSIIMDGLLGIVMGRISDKFGPRTILTICVCLVGGGYILLSRVTAIWQMYLVFGIVIGVGMSGIFVPIVTNLSRWFVARRGTMNGVVLSGMSLGTLLVSPITFWLIEIKGWRGSDIILGIAIFMIAVVSSQFMRRDPEQVGQTPFNKPGPGKRELKTDSPNFTLGEVLRNRYFWLVFLMMFCMGVFSISITVHIVPHIIHIGISPATAANILAVAGGVNFIGRVAFGPLADRIGSRQANCIGFVIMIAGLIGLIFMKDVWMFYVFAVLFGIAQGGMGTVQSPIIAELFGVRSLGAIFGACGLGLMIGASIGPVITGYIFDETGGYQIAFIACALVAIVGISINLILVRGGANTSLVSRVGA
jgi:MFS family permease